MRQTPVLLSLLFSGTLAFGADPQLMNLVMPDAKILAGVNATSARISPFGQFILSKITLMGDPQKIVAATGFNPLQDVSEVLAATPADSSSPSGLLLARGTFPVDKLVAAVTGNTSTQVSTYGGATLISFANPKEKEKVPHSVAFIGNSIAIAGDLASVKAAIDRSTGANSIDPALAVRVNQLSGSEDEWLVSSTSVASLIPANASTVTPPGPAAQILPLLKSIQSFNGGVKFSDNIAVSGEAVTSDPKNASALQAVVKLGLALATSYTSNNDPQLKELVQLLQALQVSTNGPAVDLSLVIPEAQIENLINSAPAHAKAVASAHTRSPEFHHGN
jgi:hypothetical protein